MVLGGEVNTMNYQIGSQGQKIIVSAVIQSWNYGMFIEEAIKSLLAQTRFPDELILMDDYSTDDGPAIFERYVEQFRNRRCDVVHIRPYDRLGTVAGQNLAFGAMRGEYCVGLSADDTIEPTFYEKSVALLDAHPVAGVCYPDVRLFGLYNWECRYTDDYREIMKTANCMSGSSMFRKAAFNDLGGFREEHIEDYDFFKRMIDSGRWDAVHLPEIMINWRRHDKGTRTESNDHKLR